MLMAVDWFAELMTRMCCSSATTLRPSWSVAVTGEVVPAEYGQLLEAVKREIAGARVRAAWPRRGL